MKVTGAQTDPSDQATIVNTFLVILRYNIIATNNAIDILGGQPYGNMRTFYRGSDNDFALNRGVERFRASWKALKEINSYYNPTGRIRVPLVCMHTTGDPLTPYWHEPIYRYKVFRNRSSLYHSNIPVFRYGHCNFEVDEIMLGIALMVKKVTLNELLVPRSVFPDSKSIDNFLNKAKQRGVTPKILDKLPER